ncbi:MAG: DUF3302 domain-containing protein [Betaproteobacteria bacterium]|nr:DUF3302 domain-containing protein [Betaproteobacteria bacterium]
MSPRIVKASVLRRAKLSLLGSAVAFLPAVARASLFSGDTLDSVATFMAWFVILFVPIVGIGLFLVVHVLPEKIAERRHHPQVNAIKTLCFLSLVFGGLLWPLAWLWAFTRPTQYRMAYGTEMHESYFIEMGERASRGDLDTLELEHLRDELAELSSRGVLPKALRELPAILAQARPKAQAPAPAPGAVAAQPGGGR